MMRDYLNELFKLYAPTWLIMLFDLCVVSVAYFLAYLIRFNFKLDFDIIAVSQQLPFVIVMSAMSFLIVGTFKGVFRYTGFKDIINIVIGANVLATILIISAFVSRFYGFEETFNLFGSVIYIHLLLNIFLLIGARLIVKSLYHSLIHTLETNKTVLIYGAGNSGMITYDAIANDPLSETDVAGFIDDNPKKIGKKINLLKIYGLQDITPEFIKKRKIDEIIISIQTIESDKLLHITSKLFELGLTVKIVPLIQKWIDGDLNINEIKEVKIDDLLGRSLIEIDNPVLDSEYENQIIFITGAAGSIGSELARKIIKHNVKRLVLIDSAESNLYDLQQELLSLDYKNFVATVADVRDNVRMDRLFDLHKPKVVFHAAAYKHVPLMERTPYEAVGVNIKGTRNIADLSVKHSVHKFILISTDKAVNPTSVMGASKRIAELYISCLEGIGQTRFVITRFGNVLGSSGSVIPLFKKQLEKGGPLTVTHKDITRYFMTISEACQLVLEAAAMGQGGEIYVFDMGKPIKIFNLAVNMIILSGLRYPEDVRINISGLRPGEKIYEELLADGENTVPTYHEKIMIAKTKPFDKIGIEAKIINLCSRIDYLQNIEIVSKIKDIVPEFISNNSRYEVLDR